MATPNQYFDQIYLINLPRRSDKLSKVLLGLDRFKVMVKIVAAEDGYHPKNYYSRGKLPAGAYGYVLTWKKIVRHAINHNYKRILVLDDDVILHGNFTQLFSQFTEYLENNNWKLWLLGATQHVQRPPLIQIRNQSNNDNNNDNNNNNNNNINDNNLPAYRPLRTDGSFAVAINHTIFDQLTDQLLLKDLYFDSDILRYFYQTYPNACYVSFPNLMIADVSDSDIRKKRSQVELSKKVGWNLPQYHWPNRKPLVSIVLPCYQAERSIQRCLLSLLNQTYRPLEIIVVEDGSQDNTFKLISQTFSEWEYLPKAKNITLRLLRHETNKGAYVTRNDGLDLCNGEFITFQDADDISVDFRIEDQLNSLLEKQVKFTTCLILRTHLNHLSQDPKELIKDIQNTRIHLNNYCCRSKVGLVTTMFRRQVIKQLGRYLEWKWGADSEYIRRLFPKLDPNYQMMNYLNDTEYIPNIYYCVKKILYLSYEMNDSNLTKQRLQHGKELQLDE